MAGNEDGSADSLRPAPRWRRFATIAHQQVEGVAPAEQGLTPQGCRRDAAAERWVT